MPGLFPVSVCVNVQAGKHRDAQMCAYAHVFIAVPGSLSETHSAFRQIKCSWKMCLLSLSWWELSFFSPPWPCCADAWLCFTHPTCCGILTGSFVLIARFQVARCSLLFAPVQKRFCNVCISSSLKYLRITWLAHGIKHAQSTCS